MQDDIAFLQSVRDQVLDEKTPNMFFCIGFKVLFNAFQVISGRSLLVTDSMIYSVVSLKITSQEQSYDIPHGHIIQATSPFSNYFDSPQLKSQEGGSDQGVNVIEDWCPHNYVLCAA